MSSVYTKNKEKRPRSSSNEANNSSFVKNVTSRVSGLLPSTITKWFSSPSSSNANGSAQMADATDSSTEDEACETPVITQPPAKRMRYSSPGTSYNHYGSQEAHCSTSNMDISDHPYSSYSSHPHYPQTSRSTFPSFRSSNEDISKERLDREAKMFQTQHTVAGIGQSIANKRKSIFESTSNQDEDSNNYPKPSANSSRQNEPKQPNFKPSLLGSPFYPGRTMYGGAASSYINQPNITQHRVAVVNESKINEDIAMSSSARRILEILESSSPLTEARRIPVYTRPKNDRFFKPADQSLSGNRSYSYKTQELHVPNYASILRLKKKSRLMDTTNAARQIIASQSSTSNYPSYPSSTRRSETENEQSHKLTTKMKTKITKLRGNQDAEEMGTPVILPTGVLKINKDQLPNISFGIPVIHKAPVSNTPKPISDNIFTVGKTHKHETLNSKDYIFASPVKVSCDNPQGKPNDIQKITPASKEWKCPECWVANKAESKSCVCCGYKQSSQNAIQNAKCSVCKLADSQSQKDKCVNCEKIPQLKGAEPLSTLTTGNSQTSKWKCEDCWVSNEDSSAKCACCGAKRPTKSGGAPTNVITSTSSANSESDNWKCEDCWISNKSSVDKCAACGGAKPGSKQSNNIPAAPKAPSFFGSTDDKFKKIAESQKSAKWECSSCLVRNNSDISKCACCGQAKESANKIPESKFNFGTVPNNSFKFGIDPKAQETAKVPEVKTTLEPKLKDHSETNNNVLSETPSFTFTLPTKVNENKTATSPSPKEAPKLNFAFGIPKPIAVPAVAANKTPEPKKDVDTEKNQEVPSVDQNSLNEKPKPFGNIFMAPPAQLQTTKEEKKETPPVSGISFQNPLPTDGTKETVTNSITVQPTVTSADSAVKPAFTFGVKPATNLFEAPASTAAPINLFTPQSQTTAQPANSAPTLSLFKPPESTTTTPSLFQPPDRSSVTPTPLFQKSETNSTAPAVTPAPVFSFGANAQNNSTLPSTQEKPKFQFTFGSNSAPKSEQAVPNLFKSPFGSTENNNATPNSFGMPQGTTLGSANTLTSGTLGGTNGLSTPNGLTGNAMATMPGNSIMGNSLPSGNSGIGLGANGLPVNPLTGGNTLTGGSANIFGNPIKNENMWTPANNTSTPNLFVSNTATSSLQKPATFTFGSSTSFGNPSQPAFGNNNAQSPVIFGMGSQNNSNNNNQPLLFSGSAPSQPTPNLFGSPQPPSNSAPQMGMFGTPNIGATPTFGSPNPSIPTFEPSSPAPAPAFNFGAPQSTGIFGFGQQHPMQSQQQPSLPHSPQQPSGVYSFGGTPAGAPHVQFTVGSGPNTAVRRVRKAVRRNPQR
ncbi:nuclear pore complex protein Nup153 isoform X2 [Trichoplusia ni]|uniref:Nuclear pore complex protein Nup153 n=1 Tax=Trichoplusia ni TaxID=7111 RepID=A0A7E5WWJ2_TRINI|nr:nuclear pore complex protein Nup153 isoform X2 [Trichoplusia ni]